MAGAVDDLMLRARPQAGTSRSFELDVACVEEKCSLCEHEQNSDEGAHGVPVAVMPGRVGNLGAVAMCTQEVVTRPCVAVQSITAEIRAHADEGKEVDRGQYHGRIEDPLCPPRVAAELESRFQDGGILESRGRSCGQARSVCRERMKLQEEGGGFLGAARYFARGGSVGDAE
jgi:hypothetical protein